MARYLSDIGALSLLSREGIVLVSYKDSVGVWTIGVGHTAAAGGLKPGPGVVLPDVAAALALYLVDAGAYAAAVDRAVKVALTQPQFDALVSWHYNTGAAGKASFIKGLNAAKTPAEIARIGAAGLNQWKANRELIARRDQEIAQWNGVAQPSTRSVAFWEKEFTNKGRSARTVTAADIAAARQSIALTRPDLAPVVLPAGGPTLPAPPPIAPPAPIPASPAPAAVAVEGSWWDRLKTRWQDAYGKKEG